MSYNPRVKTSRNAIDTASLFSLPECMKAGRSFTLWHMGRRNRMDGSPNPELTKVPCTAEFQANSRFLQVGEGITWDDAVRAAGRHLDDGVMSIGYVVGRETRGCIDLDYKGEYDGETLKTGTSKSINGYELPLCVADIVERAAAAGAYVEMSPSLKGVHIWLAAKAPAPHGVLWTFKQEYMDSIGCERRYVKGDKNKGIADKGVHGEVYTRSKFLTLTGLTLNTAEQLAVLNLPIDAAPEPQQRWFEEFLSGSYINISGGSANAVMTELRDVRVQAARNPRYVPSSQLTGKLAAAAQDQVFARLWDNDTSVLGELKKADLTPSTMRWELMRRLARVNNGDVVATADAFAKSALLDARGFEPRGGDVRYVYEVKRAVSSYLRFREDCTPQVAEWSEEARRDLIKVVLRTATGTSAQRECVADLLRELFKMLDDGRHHIHDHHAVLHHGGTKLLADLLGKRGPDVVRYLTWMAETGIIASFVAASETNNWRSQIHLAARPANCTALSRGSLRECPRIPARPGAGKPRKPRQSHAERGAEAQPRQVMLRTYDRTRWTAWMICNGSRSVRDIADGIGKSPATVKKHVAALVAEGAITKELEPVLCQADFDAKRAAELKTIINARHERIEASKARRAKFLAEKGDWSRGDPNPLITPEVQVILDAFDDAFYLMDTDMEVAA